MKLPESSRRAVLAWLLGALTLAQPGCTFSLDWYRHYQAERSIERQDYPSALNILQKIVQNNPDGPRAPLLRSCGRAWPDHEVRIGPIIGDVEGKDVIVLDDEIARGTTTMELLHRLREDKAARDVTRERA